MRHVVTSYSELHKWSKAYADGAFGLFFLVGLPGLGKSRHLKSLLMDKKPKPSKPKTPPHRDHIPEPLWVEGGSVSAFKLYQNLWYHLHETVVLDDVDSVYTDRLMIRLLKALCQTEREKSIGWHTENSILLDRGIPKTFSTRSRVCIIANRWHTLNEHVGSLTDRGMLIQFEPSPAEVLKFAKTIKFVPVPGTDEYRHVDNEIMKFVDNNLWLVDQISLRDLRSANEAKNAKLDWKAALGNSLEIRELLVYLDLEKGHYHSEEQRAGIFMERTGLSRPLYFKAKSKVAEIREEKGMTPRLAQEHVA